MLHCTEVPSHIQSQRRAVPGCSHFIKCCTVTALLFLLDWEPSTWWRQEKAGFWIWSSQEIQQGVIENQDIFRGMNALRQRLYDWPHPPKEQVRDETGFPHPLLNEILTTLKTSGRNMDEYELSFFWHWGGRFMTASLTAMFSSSRRVRGESSLWLVLRCFHHFSFQILPLVFYLLLDILNLIYSQPVMLHCTRLTQIPQTGMFLIRLKKQKQNNNNKGCHYFTKVC